MMRTIAFHSHKGGVGRTLALANLAAILANRGHRVVILDLDIDAPGIHMKFKLENFGERSQGFLEHLRRCYNQAKTTEGKLGLQPDKEPPVDLPRKVQSLKSKATYHPADIKSAQNIIIIPAASADPTKYLRLLRSSVWIYKLFSPPANDDAAARLQDQVLADHPKVIEKLFNAGSDYLLIDCKSAGACSRYVLSNWADVVVTMFPANSEGIEGAVQSVLMTRAGRGTDVPVIPVLCRVSEKLPTDREMGATRDKFKLQLRERLQENGLPDISSSLRVLHEYRALEDNERILFAIDRDNATPDQVLLAHDYLELFHQIDEAADADFGSLVDLKTMSGLSLEAQIFERVFEYIHSTGQLRNPRDGEDNVALRRSSVTLMMTGLFQLGASEQELSAEARTSRARDYHSIGLSMGRDFGNGQKERQAETFEEAVKNWFGHDEECGFGTLKYKPGTDSTPHTIRWENAFLIPSRRLSDPKNPSWTGMPDYLKRFAEGYIQGVLERLLSLEEDILKVSWSAGPGDETTDVAADVFEFHLPTSGSPSSGME